MASTQTTIIPTILTGDPAEYAKFIQLYPTFAKRIQIDIADGTFVATTTIPVSSISALPPNIQFDLHMMVVHPSQYLADILRLKPSMVIFHAEAGESLLPTFAELHKAGIKTGVALMQSTYPGNAKAYIDAVDHVLIFAGKLGKQGGTADLLQIEKVKLIHAINPNVEIGWDGGVNLDNVRAIAHAEINAINVGSFISMNPNPADAYQKLVEEADKTGVALS